LFYFMFVFVVLCAVVYSELFLCLFLSVCDYVRLFIWFMFF